MSAFASSLAWIESRREAMLAQTLEWSRINSGSLNLAGLARMCSALEDAFAPLGGVMERVDLPPREVVNAQGDITRSPLGQALRIRKHSDAPLRVFLGGHMDTVFAADHPFQEPQQRDEHSVNGPGVADLKGGLSVMLAALTALEQSPYAGNIGWEIFINPDEEIGSPGSDSFFREIAARNHIGLLYEPAMADGTLAGKRKGSGNFTAVMRGKAAHVGRAFQDGRNAVVALAELTQALAGLTGAMPGVTCNPGKLEGGGPVNMVPDLAILRFNVRVDTQAEQAWVLEQLEALQAAFNAREGFSLHIHGGFSRPPKLHTPEQEKLFALLLACGEEVGVAVKHVATGGCCDGNNLAAYGLPNIDTLGVRGGHLHTDQEFMVIESLTERAKLSALLLLKLASGEVSL